MRQTDTNVVSIFEIGYNRLYVYSFPKEVSGLEQGYVAHEMSNVWERG